MSYLLALSLLTVAALLWLLHQERRERTRLLDQARLERAGLLNRIQAPEVAVGDSLSPQGEPEQGWVDYDSDEALHKELERLSDGSDS